MELHNWDSQSHTTRINVQEVQQTYNLLLQAELTRCTAAIAL